MATAGAQIAIGFAIGMAVWIIPYPEEPWDRTTVEYSLPLFVGGLVGSFCRTKGFYWGAVGVALGQTAFQLATIPLVRGPIIMPPPIGILMFGTFQPVAGGLIGAAVGYAWKRLRFKKSG